jgi:hypothetical protein
MGILVPVVALLLLGPGSVLAQETPGNTPGVTGVTRAESIAGSAQTPRRPLIELAHHDAARLVSASVAALPRSAPLPPQGWQQASDAQAQSDESRKRGWIRRHPARFGALLGAGLGAGAALAMDNEFSCSGGDDDCLVTGGGRAITGAAVGAGVGALVGWLVSLGGR